MCQLHSLGGNRGDSICKRSVVSFLVVGETTSAVFLEYIKKPLGDARLLNLFDEESREERTTSFLIIDKPTPQECLFVMGTVSYERGTSLEPAVGGAAQHVRRRFIFPLVSGFTRSHP